jgi:hypothetical protein
MRRGGHVVCMGGNAYRVLVGKPEGKRSLGRPRHKLEDSIKIHTLSGLTDVVKMHE